MANISVDYTFVNGTTADATEINTNFQNIIDGTSDATKDFSISALTCAGAVTLNGNVTLGNATSDDITITGRVASDIDPKTAATNTLGDATQTWQALYLDNTSVDGGAIFFDSGSTEFIKSTADGSELDISGFTTVHVGGSIIAAPLTTGTTSIPGDSSNKLFSGSYTPTLVCTGWTFSSVGANYLRVGNMITVCGYAVSDAGPRSGTVLSISLPMGGNFGTGPSNRQQAQGAIYEDAAGSSAYLQGRVSSNLVESPSMGHFNSTSIGLRYHFTYEVQ